MALSWALWAAAESAGRTGWLHVWSATSKPSVASVRTSLLHCASLTPMLKKVARTWFARRIARIFAVLGPGPSSNVSATVRAPLGTVGAVNWVPTRGAGHDDQLGETVAPSFGAADAPTPAVAKVPEAVNRASRNRGKRRDTSLHNTL